MSELSTRQRENLELARRVYAAFNAGDVDAFLGMSDEALEFYVSGGSTAGTYRGHDGYRRWHREWLGGFGEYKVELLAIEPIGERHVVTLAHQIAKGKGSGVPVEMDSGNMLEFRQGKLVALQLYLTHEEAIQVAKRREAGEPNARLATPRRSIAD